MFETGAKAIDVEVAAHRKALEEQEKGVLVVGKQRGLSNPVSIKHVNDH